MNGSVHDLFLCILLVVYRKPFDHSKLILYSVVLLKLFIISRNVPLEFWRPLMYNISPVDRDSSTFSFPSCIPLVSFYCHYLPSAWSTILKRNGHSEQPVPFLISMGFFQVFLHLDKLAVGLSYITFIMLRGVPFSPTL